MGFWEAFWVALSEHDAVREMFGGVAVPAALLQREMTPEDVEAIAPGFLAEQQRNYAQKVIALLSDEAKAVMRKILDDPDNGYWLGSGYAPVRIDKDAKKLPVGFHDRMRRIVEALYPAAEPAPAPEPAPSTPAAAEMVFGAPLQYPERADILGMRSAIGNDTACFPREGNKVCYVPTDESRQAYSKYTTFTNLMAGVQRSPSIYFKVHYTSVACCGCGRNITAYMTSDGDRREVRTAYWVTDGSDHRLHGVCAFFLAMHPEISLQQYRAAMGTDVPDCGHGH